ncbi:MAG: hypothetical protein H7339_17935 [Arcicella sp.]|nr:hypothetical protein [Arcicella sp.]
MKKKAIFTTVLATLLSFGMMANVKSIKHSETYHKVKMASVTKKETKKAITFCCNVTLSCGISGVACGPSISAVISAVLEADDVYCGC